MGQGHSKRTSCAPKKSRRKSKKGHKSHLLSDDGCEGRRSERFQTLDEVNSPPNVKAVLSVEIDEIGAVDDVGGVDGVGTSPIGQIGLRIMMQVHPKRILLTMVL